MGTHSVSMAPALDSLSDLDLVELTRSGNKNAFAELWRRHSVAGRAVARSYSNDPDDTLAESFARILAAIQAGRGPTTAFRAYLFTTIRSIAYQSRRGPATDTVEDFDIYADPDSAESVTLEALDRSLTAQAFRSLPTRWQEALWYSEVEQLSSAEIAPLLGMKPNAVNALTFRAREGLRQAWIQAHLARSKDSECAAVIERLGSYSRGTLGPRESRRVEEHLTQCQSCQIVAEEAREVSSKLALVLLPLVAGVTGATGYSAWLQSESHEAPVPYSEVAAAIETPARHGVGAWLASGSGAASFTAAGLSVAAAVVAAIVLVPLAATPVSAPPAISMERVIHRPDERPREPDSAATPLQSPPAATPQSPTETRPPAGSPPSESVTPAGPSPAPGPNQTPTANPNQPPAPPSPPPPPVTPPLAPTTVILVDPDGLYLPLISGKAQPGALLQAVSGTGDVVGETTAAQDGMFSFTDLPGIGFGPSTVAVRQVAGGLVSPLTTAKQISLQSISAEYPSPGSAVSAPGFAMLARGVPLASVSVDGGTVSPTILATAGYASQILAFDNTGYLSHDIEVPADATGTITVTLRYVGDGGRFGPPFEATYTIVPETP